MGKRYYCNYCNKTMVATPTILKTHNRGLGHQKLVIDHYQQFKDPETILAEESTKKPCLRYPKGECPFGYMCRFSHYTLEQLAFLKQQVELKNKDKSVTQQPSFGDLYEKLQTERFERNKNSEEGTTISYDRNGVTHILPWTYNDDLEKLGTNLPPSIRRINLDEFTDVNLTEWG